jgi:hypothetical protein
MPRKTRRTTVGTARTAGRVARLRLKRITSRNVHGAPGCGKQTPESRPDEGVLAATDDGGDHAVEVDAADAVVALVGDVEVAGGVERKSGWSVQLRRRRGSDVSAEAGDADTGHRRNHTVAIELRPRGSR